MTRIGVGLIALAIFIVCAICWRILFRWKEDLNNISFEEKGSEPRIYRIHPLMFLAPVLIIGVMASFIIAWNDDLYLVLVSGAFMSGGILLLIYLPTTKVVLSKCELQYKSGFKTYKINFNHIKNISRDQYSIRISLFSGEVISITSALYKAKELYFYLKAISK